MGVSLGMDDRDLIGAPRVRDDAAVGHLHLRYLNPLPTDLGDVARRYRRVLVPELNLGQLALLIRDRCMVEVVQLDKVQGRPFGVAEVYQRIMELVR